jgi:hypothetical protein
MCDGCGGPLQRPPIGNFYVVRASLAIVNPGPARQVLGLTQYFNGALGLAEVMAPAAEDAIIVAGDKEPGLMTELLLCFDCWTRPLCLSDLAEKRAAADGTTYRACALPGRAVP